MTPGEAEKVYDRFDEALSAAEAAIDCARRNVGRRNGFYSTDPQLREARNQLAKALEVVPFLEQAAEVLG